MVYKEVVSTRSEGEKKIQGEDRQRQVGRARSRGDFGHRRYIWCAGNSTWPLQLPFLLLALALLLFCLYRCQDLQLLRDKVRRARSVRAHILFQNAQKLPNKR
jgi:hypothetical protein